MISKITKILLGTALSLSAGKQISAAEVAYQTNLIPAPKKYIACIIFTLTTILCVCLAFQCLKDAFPEQTKELSE